MNALKLTLTAAALAALSAVQAQPASTPASSTSAPDDPHFWLEEVQGEKALNWVRERNKASEAVLRARPEFAPIRERTLSILASTDKIPYVYRQGDHVYNLWTDAKNKRGLLRRTTLVEYKKTEPAWETVLDVDALGAAEEENWVYKGMSCLPPAYMQCMVSVSRGGADAVVQREFDAKAKQFVKDGFVTTEAKQSVQWRDADHLLIGTDFGAGSMTKSGYPRIAKLWKRGTPLTQAITLFEGLEADVSAGVGMDRSVSPPRMLAYRSVDFWNTETLLQKAGGGWDKVDKPSDATFVTNGDWAFIQPRTNWTVGGKTQVAGSLLATKLADYLAGKRDFTVLFAPTATTSLGGYTTTKDHVLVNVLDNVASRLVEWKIPAGAATWAQREVKLGGGQMQRGTLSISSWYDPTQSNDAFASTYSVNYADFLTPDSYYLAKAGSDEVERLKSLPARFNADGMKSEQRFATSKDGTRIPYFLVLPKGYSADKPVPTMLYGYGGFRIAQRPFYSGSWGAAWLERGGAVVVANIRGGNEFGPAWHNGAIREKKQKSYDDFIAVAQDLVKTKVTSPKQLGIYGGSNGGLLTGAVAMQRPDLFGAVISAVPLLDMKRYHVMLAGNSWMAEYGNPDKAEDWEFIKAYSPYHNIKKDLKYPRILFTTSTRDDRVHPGHARKMVARMQELGHDVLYFENIEGGHGGAADLTQRADLTALQFSYFWMQLGGQ
jgi:prolyl oligopeptidase